MAASRDEDKKKILQILELEILQTLELKILQNPVLSSTASSLKWCSTLPFALFFLVTRVSIVFGQIITHFFRLVTPLTVVEASFS